MEYYAAAKKNKKDLWTDLEWFPQLYKTAKYKRVSYAILQVRKKKKIEEKNTLFAHLGKRCTERVN